jgi:uncharacterized protein (TIGR02284 family)
MHPDDTIEQLNELIRLNRDAEAGFLNAAENVRNSELDTLFHGYARQHAKFAADLGEEVERLGGDVSDSGTAGGALHRGWMDLKAVLSGHSAAAILASCASGEESADAAYARATDVIRSGQTHTLLERQHRQVQEICTRLSRLVGETEKGVEFQNNESPT